MFIIGNYISKAIALIGRHFSHIFHFVETQTNYGVPFFLNSLENYYQKKREGGVNAKTLNFKTLLKPTLDSCGFTCEHFGKHVYIVCYYSCIHMKTGAVVETLPILLRDRWIFAAVIFKDANDEIVADIRGGWSWDWLNYLVVTVWITLWQLIMSSNDWTQMQTQWNTQLDAIGPVMFTTWDPLTTHPY